MSDTPEPVYTDGTVTLFNGACEEQLKALPENSVDAVICDPPYGMSSDPDMAEVLKHWLAGDDYTHKGGGFMGRSWDSFVPGPSIWREVFRVLKPGGMLAAFASTRTADLMGIAIRLAGFERRDTILHIGSEAVEIDDVEMAWIYGSGFPKEGDLGVAVDRHLGHEPVPVKREAERGYTPGRGFSLLEENEVVVEDATRTSGIGAAYQAAADGETWQAGAGQQVVTELEPVSEEGKRWRGWSSTLKPANEPIILARKPLAERNIPANLVAHGVGAYNIAGATVGDQPRFNPPSAHTGDRDAPVPISNGTYTGNVRTGRWPANVAVSHSEGCELVGDTKQKAVSSVAVPDGNAAGGKGSFKAMEITLKHVEDGVEKVEVWRCVEGCQVRELDKQGSVEIAFQERRTGELGVAVGVSRFMYCPKPTRAEKDAGIVGEAEYVQNRAGGSGIARDERVRELRRQGLSQQDAEAQEPVGKNTHLTVKPIALMEWLVKLLCPPGGTVLDPFMGSGTTGCAVARLEGFRFVGVELDEAFVKIARERIVHWAKVAEDARSQQVLF